MSKLKIITSLQMCTLLESEFYLASKFELGKRYSEKEVNEILNNWHTFEDWAMLRRDLFDKWFLGRDPKGKEYWLEEKQPTLASFGFENL